MECRFKNRLRYEMNSKDKPQSMRECSYLNSSSSSIAKSCYDANLHHVVGQERQQLAIFRNRKLVEYQDALNGQCTHHNIIRSMVNTNFVEVGGVAKALQLHCFRDGGVATFARPAKFMIEDSIFL